MPFPKTFDAYVPSDGQEFFKVAKFKPDYVALADLQAVALDAAHHASFALAGKMTPPATFTHCSRVYFFGMAMLYNGFPSETPGVPQISFEDLTHRWYHCAMLHDLGLSKDVEALAHPANAMSFELHGGFMAYDHLHAVDPTLNAIQVRTSVIVFDLINEVGVTGWGHRTRNYYPHVHVPLRKELCRRNSAKDVHRLRWSGV